jgi:cell wall-associated NlpC family hydrolase
MIDQTLIKYGNRQYKKDVFHCWTFVKEVYLDYLGIELYDPGINCNDKNWARHGHDYVSENAHEWIPVPEPKEYDLVAFKNDEDVVFHIGIMANRNEFVHCCSCGVKKDSMTNSRWQERFAGYYRHKARI